MKKSEIKLLLLELFCSCILVLNIFVKNVLNDYTLVLIVFIAFVISILLVGFEKNKVLNKKKIVIATLTFSIAFLVLLYGIGLFTGFVRNGYSLKILNILINTIPIILLFSLEELLRYNVLKKSNNNKILVIATIVFFTLLDVSLYLHLYNIYKIKYLLQLITIVVIPSIFKNIMLTDFSFYYGYEPCVTYLFIINLYKYIIPILPNLNVYLESIFMFITPIIMRYIINTRFKPKKQESLRDKNIISKIISIIFIMLMIIIVMFYSNLFRFWVAVIGSGSMSPTINVGDIIIVDKKIKSHLEELKVGDVLVFKVKDSIYTHRIVKIDELNGKYSITTKGDRKGNSVDNWTITNDDIVGVVKAKINYIGYPSVWLNELAKGR